MALQRLAMLSVHTSPLAPPGGKKTGGMNVYVRELALEFGRRGIDVDIYTRRISSDQPDVDCSLAAHVRVVHVPAGPAVPLNPDDVYPHLSQFTAGVMAFATRHNLRYDVIYSHYWLSGVVAQTLKEVWRTPFVQMFHTLGHMKNRILTRAAAPQPDTRIRAETQVTRWADRLIAATPAEQAQLLWLYRADRRKITVVSPGVNIERFHPDRSRGQTIATPGKDTLLFVGRIEPLKGVDTILDALDVIRRRDPALFQIIRLIVVGGNPNDPADTELHRLRQRVEALGLTGAVEFHGAKDQTALPDYYAAAAAVLVPSDYESFGMVALEAMASGTPVIASEVGGLAFLVRDGETGYLVPARDPEALADRITWLLRDPDKLARMRTAAAELARRYTWSSIADQLQPIFEALAKTPGSPAALT